ncbi:tyrosine-protein kinase family protein [Rhodobacteraceae bacterium W635]|uniref:CpsD/CapB family tyrosine-protein kinase n=1 Tax=Nioella halotolerans TaxID=2303578 RepID=UPI000E3B86C2|nr:tyrosine-protein kinase family protein [Rhodobacteraceae bacterium W635]
MSSNSRDTGPDGGLSDRDRQRRALERRLREALMQPAEADDAAPAPDDAPPAPADAATAPRPQADPAIWGRLPRIPVEPRRLDRNLVITASRHDPAHAAFDVLRTRIVRAMRDNGWHRVGITSAGEGNGKSFTAINLAISLSRLSELRTVLMDMDLRRPGLAKILGLRDMPATADYLRGEVGTEAYFSTFAPNSFHIGERLAIGVNGRTDAYAAELFQTEETGTRLAAMQAELATDLVLFDLPPALAMDDVLAFREHLDCVLLVVGGGETRARELREVQRRLGDDLPILGVVMNKAEVEDDPGYSYGR